MCITMTALGLMQRKLSRTLQLLQSTSILGNQSRVVIRNESSLVPKRVLILRKVSRYYFEKLRVPESNESQLRKRLIERGSDYDALLASHRTDEEMESTVKNTLKELNIEYKSTNRLSMDHSAFDWADLILPIGGDGTFLFSSNLIYNSDKPIMGINSDPSSSEGYLMLAKKYTKDIKLIFEHLKAGEYKYLMRSRIRTTLKGKGVWSTPFHMHGKWKAAADEKQKIRLTDSDTAAENNNSLRFYLDDCSRESEKKQPELPDERRLPWLALNEVFMGESLSARTSTLDIRLEGNDPSFKVKSCGLCASTGTGSTSWHRAINSLNKQIVNDVLKLGNIKVEDDSIAENISEEYNKRLQFPAGDRRIAYTVRDMIVGKNLPFPKGIQPRGYCDKLVVRSHCFDAGLVVDGGIAVPFNDGTIAAMEIHPEDSLRTIVLPE